MSRTYRGDERKIRVRGIRRKTDAKRLARALSELEYQRAQTEAEAEVEYDKNKKNKTKPDHRKNTQ
jgi:hypothetical protein